MKLKSFPILLIILISALIAAAGNPDFSEAVPKKKKEKKVKKEKKIKKPSGCDTAKLVRTSEDPEILKKYTKTYAKFGGLCYILHLQQIGKIKQMSDTSYRIVIKDKGTPESRMDWQTVLFCPIGKPNGLVVLVSPKGDTVQTCQYQNERKNGVMTWWQPGKGVIAAIRYKNDEKAIPGVN
ncbi:MAG: hypothetical protein Fur0041_04330 [Bacteroidia bacterium]